MSVGMLHFPVPPVIVRQGPAKVSVRPDDGIIVGGGIGSTGQTYGVHYKRGAWQERLLSRCGLAQVW